MKLTEANKQLNRRFHELPENEREPFLLRAYSQVFPTAPEQGGEFTPPKIDDKFKGGKLKNREEKRHIWDTIDNLNFLMTRFNMLHNPQYEEQIRNLALLRFDYILLSGNTEYTQNVGLVAKYFMKRGKKEWIRPAFENMGEHGVNYDFIAEDTINSPIFAEQVPNAKEFKFRARLHTLLHDEEYEKDEAASILMKEGYNLVEMDFNKWIAFDKDYRYGLGELEYKVSEKDERRLQDFVERQRPNPSLLVIRTEEDKDAEPRVPKGEDEEEPNIELKNSMKRIKVLNRQIRNTAKKMGEKTPYWIAELSALTQDYKQIKIGTSDRIQSKMWDYIWGGDFLEFARQLKGAGNGRTRKGLEYCKWALKNPKYKETINPTMAQDSYAMIIASDALGDLESIANDLNDPLLSGCKNEDKVRAAVNLAWEVMQHPTDDEHESEKEYLPPRNYLLRVARELRPFLVQNESAQPYLRLIDATPETKLGEEEEKILDSLKSLEDIEDVFTKVGRESQIRKKFLQLFDKAYEKDSEFCGLYSSVTNILRLIQNPTFRRHVDDNALSEKLSETVHNTLFHKKNRWGEVDSGGTRKLVATMYSNPTIRPYIEGKVDMGKMINEAIDDEVRGNKVITEPYSLNHNGEISMGSGEVLEIYELAESVRKKVDQEKMKDLVAYMMALVLDDRHGYGFSISANFMKMKSDKEGHQMNRELYSPSKEDKRNMRFEFLTKLYEREKELGGLDPRRVENAVTNIMFRSNYVEPKRYCPHLDTMMQFFSTPLARVIPTEGLCADAIKEYKIMYDFLGGNDEKKS